VVSFSAHIAAGLEPIEVGAIELRPRQLAPRPGESIRYLPMEWVASGELQFLENYRVETSDPSVLELKDQRGLVREFKTRGRPVVYFVSEEFPDWYTEDRRPDLAVISEGQEHEILVDADRVVFTGGGLMYCTLRNVQYTLHRMIRAGTRDRLHFIFPPDAIWVGVLDPYPAPMALLSSLLARSATDIERYETVVVPFLDRLLTDYPVFGMPANAPEPELSVLVEGWNIEVRLGDSFERSYRHLRRPRRWSWSSARRDRRWTLVFPPSRWCARCVQADSDP
jgi:hypothetical protein